MREEDRSEAHCSERTSSSQDSGETVAYRGEVKRVENHLGSFGVLDFSEVKTEGAYRIRFGNTVSQRFTIGNDILESSLWKLINFLYCERCGYPVPNCHGTCHQDVIAEHNGVKLVMGGWHDAADVSERPCRRRRSWIP
ncbi:MAG: glycoside hydrolase family 9 protein [Lacrimispora sp.]